MQTITLTIDEFKQYIIATWQAGNAWPFKDDSGELAEYFFEQQLKQEYDFTNI